MTGTAKKLVLETVSEFFGVVFGADTDTLCEVVFNTSMVGYQEILSDLSYFGQMVCMTYPLIGNYGLAEEDYETKKCRIGGFIVREYNDTPSNYRYVKTLSEEMEECGIPGICGVDTRMITRMIRDEGSMRAVLTGADTSTEHALDVLRRTPEMHDQVSRVSSTKPWYSRTANHRYNVVAVDCGIKMNIVRSLNRRGCNVTVVPYDTPAAEILALRPDGLFLSNGPGNPEDNKEVIELVRTLQGRLPIFGICLGHQMIALANGARTYKMKFGHRGGNHPVKDLRTGRIEITSQNHSYAVDPDSLAGTGLELTHINLLDNTAEGLASDEQSIFSVQYHPESAPGPQDSGHLFDRFTALMDRHIKKEAGKNA
ncbi:MAG: glutamine-hydrolyzing carbamoyl-phosphate synthase small subunit [Clostridia bacterium]|nr:glutamine-hydrolyzing carbamoyl-phosphate synthase small subunit [Clostridia bacterium]